MANGYSGHRYFLHLSSCIEVIWSRSSEEYKKRTLNEDQYPNKASFYYTDYIYYYLTLESSYILLILLHILIICVYATGDTLHGILIHIQIVNSSIRESQINISPKWSNHGKATNIADVSRRRGVWINLFIDIFQKNNISITADLLIRIKYIII